MSVIGTELANEFAALRGADLAEDGLECAADAFLDWLGCAVLGASSKDNHGAALHPEATVVGTGSRTSLLQAVLANSLAGRVQNVLGDRLGTGDACVGNAVMPAVLALSERQGLPGRDLLAAVALGYEIAAKVTSLEVPLGYACAAAMVEGCAAAGACAFLLKVTVAAIGRAVDIACSQRVEPAALNGLLAAYAAAGSAGEASRPAPLATFSATALRQRQVRLHAAAEHTHSAIDAALELKNAYRLHPEDLDAIEVQTFAEAVARGSADATSSSDLRENIAFCLAMVFLRGQVSPAELRPQFLLKAPVGWVMAQTTIMENPEFTAMFPQARPARVTVRTRYGNLYERAVLHPRGSPKNRASSAEIAAKFMALAGPVLPQGSAELLLERVKRLPVMADVRELFAGLPQ